MGNIQKSIIFIFTVLIYDNNAYADCQFDRDRMLALDIAAFDQDMDGGWRKVASKPECEPVAADLIHAYRDKENFPKKYAGILYWHEGQLRAGLGETEAAIALFESAKSRGDAAWNLYVDATIAFLRRDKAQLLAARKQLATLPKPPGYGDGYQTDINGNRIELPWPPNLTVVDKLIACFDKSYEQAYRC